VLSSPCWSKHDTSIKVDRIFVLTADIQVSKTVNISVDNYLTSG
jgi:hypothetical protein